jgi:transcriptional regulator with XRE-family HTH domain
MKVNPDRFALARAKACMSVRDVKALAKVSPANLARIGRGEGDTQPQIVGRLAKALGVTVEYLVGEVQ